MASLTALSLCSRLSVDSRNNDIDALAFVSNFIRQRPNNVIVHSATIGISRTPKVHSVSCRHVINDLYRHRSIAVITCMPAFEDPMMGSPDVLDLSRADFSQTHEEIAMLGSGSFGAAVLARKKYADTSAKGKPSRSSLVVVKYYDPQNSANDAEGKVLDLTNEIKVLKLLDDKHPRVLQIIDSHIAGPIQWFTTPWLSGGDLEKFKKTFPQSITPSFAWHVTHCVTEALLYLFFGIPAGSDPEKMKRKAGWPLIFHGDLHLGNLLLGPPCDDGPMIDMLDTKVVVADFGHSEYDTSVSRGRAKAFAADQAMDLIYFGARALGELNRMSAAVNGGKVDSELSHWVRTFQGMYRAIGHGETEKWIQKSLLTFMAEFLAVADHQRMKAPGRVRPDVEAYLRGEQLKLDIGGDATGVRHSKEEDDAVTG